MTFAPQKLLLVFWFLVIVHDKVDDWEKSRSFEKEELWSWKASFSRHSHKHQNKLTALVSTNAAMQFINTI